MQQVPPTRKRANHSNNNCMFLNVIGWFVRWRALFSPLCNIPSKITEFGQYDPLRIFLMTVLALVIFGFVSGHSLYVFWYCNFRIPGSDMIDPRDISDTIEFTSLWFLVGTNIELRLFFEALAKIQ